jgi:4-amino-4-deoxy-L-arabinose transferase-like glycosyltransferase
LYQIAIDQPVLRKFVLRPQAAIFLTFVAMLLASWRRWISPITDSGREMDLPLRLMKGEWLYRDIHYLYPPFSPYFNALLYRVFGARLEVLQASGVVCSVLIVWLCYRIARRLLTPAEATLALIAVVLLSVFKPGGNLIWPYAFAALHGAVFTLGGLLLTLRYAENEKRRDLILAGTLIGLAAITKQEFALAGAVALTSAAVWLRRKDFKRLLADLALAATPALLIALPVYASLLAWIGWKTIVEDCHLFYTRLPASLVYYNSQRTGFDRPLFSFAQMVGAAAVGTATLSGIALLSARGGMLIRRVGRAQWVWIAFGGSLLVAAVIKQIVGKQWDGSPLRALPFMLLIMIVNGWRRRTQNASDHGALFILAVYGLAILGRVALRVPSGGTFGSFFLPTSLILFCYLFLRVAPDAIDDQLARRRARMIGGVALLILLLATAVVFTARYRRNFDFELQTPHGDLYVRRPVGQAFREALDFIAERTTPEDAIAVLPEGSDLAFLGGRRMALRMQIAPPGFLDEQGERAEIARLQAARVRYVFITNRPMREFGAETFGRDFYPTLGRWIEDHYRLVKVCGLSKDERVQIGDPSFFVKILERRPDIQ